jgi:hypothetical protein
MSCCAPAVQVILMTIPLATYKPEFAPYIPIWEQRNQVMSPLPRGSGLL